MPILAYCMTEPAFSPHSPLTGVDGAAVEAIEAGGVRCFYSRVPEESSGTRAQDGALAFHRVLQEVFAQTAILPFRFPTIVEAEPELTAHILEHAVEYRRTLVRLRDLVQMEILIQANPTSRKSEESSGAQYLRKRLAQQKMLETAAEGLRTRVAFLVQGWRQRESKDGLRCFMLLGRGHVSQLRAALSGVQLSPDLGVRVSGPWPATEFVNED